MTRRILFLIVLLTLCVAVNAQAAAFMDPNLVKILNRAQASDQIDVYVVLKQQLNLQSVLAEVKAQGGGRARRHFEVVTRLQDLAERSQSVLMDMATASAAIGGGRAARSGKAAKAAPRNALARSSASAGGKGRRAARKEATVGAASALALECPERGVCRRFR